MRRLWIVLLAAVSCAGDTTMGKGFQKVRSQATAAGKVGLDRRESVDPIYATNDAWLNRPAVITGQIIIPAAGFVQGPNVVIPDGIPILLKGRSTNAANVRMSGSQSKVVATDQAYDLQASEQVMLMIQNLNQLFFGGTAGDIVFFIVEQDKPEKKQ